MLAANKHDASPCLSTVTKKHAHDTYIDDRRKSLEAATHVNDEAHKTVPTLTDLDTDEVDMSEQQQQQPVTPAITMESMAATIVALQQQLAALQAASSPTTETTKGTKAPTSNKRRTVDQKFDGKRENYRAWKSLVLMNAEADQKYWDSQFAMIVWIRGLLENEAANTMRAWMDSYNSNRIAGTLPAEFNAWENLWATLDKYYANQFDQTRRIADYHRVKQGSRAHIEYYNEWEQKRVAAGIDGSAESLLSDYMRGMNAKLRDHLQGFVALQTRSWDGHINLISRMAEDWESYHSYSNNKETSSRVTSYDNHMTNRSRKELTTSQGGNAMDLDHKAMWAGKRAKYVDNDEVNRRRQNRLCLRCGGTGHIIRNCPLLPAERPGSNNARMASGRFMDIPDDAWVNDNTDNNEAVKE